MNDRYYRTTVWQWLRAEALRRLPVSMTPSCGRRAAIVLALAWASISPASSQESIVYLLVRQSCGAWLEERKGESQNLQIWVLGFLSGASVYGGIGLLRNPLIPNSHSVRWRRTWQ